MRGNNRKSIEKCRKRLPQFTTMNVIDGQAGLVIYSSLIFYSLTIYNILNIIVLLLLAGISFMATTGNKGIISKSNKAKIEAEVTKYKEQLEIIKHKEYADGYTLDINIFLNKYAEAVKKDKMFKNVKEVTVDYGNELVIVVTKEGYIFEVTVKDTVYVGKETSGGSTVVDISKVKITITSNQANWTNGKVKVKITSNVTRINKEYSLDGGKSWKEYENEIEIEDNGTEIQARGVNEKNEKTEVVKKKIKNIDRLQPNVSVPTLVEGVDTIKVTTNATDQEATAINGKSEIRGYKFSKDGGVSWTEEQSSNVYTFGRLIPGVIYRIKVKVIDNAGNEKDTQEVIGTTETIPGENNNIYFDYSPSEWTNKNVIVTITASTEKYQLQYSRDGRTWHNYNSQTKVEMTENGPIYARLAYGENYGATATGNVENIDRILPTGNGTVTLKSKSDKEATIQITATDAHSGLASITNKTTEFIRKENDTTYKVTKNGIFEFEVRDRAGNTNVISVKVEGFLWEETKISDTQWYSYNDVSNGDKKANVNPPKLGGNMKPIKYVGAEANSQGGSKWANAMTSDGSMFVWLPRYAYKITEGYHTNVAGIIEVAFLDTNNNFLNGETGVLTTNPEEEGAGQTKWLVHPAFTSNVEYGGGFGEISGLWVGKFEATGEYKNGDASKVSVKPGISSLREMILNDQYKAGMNAQYGENINLNSHLIKNSELGATVYLAHSKYGTNKQKVEANISTSYYTGGTNIVAEIYTTNKKQSTTHNATGVYDLNGGAWEYTAAYANNGHKNLEKNGGIAKGDLYGATREERSTSTKYKTVYSATNDWVVDYNMAGKKNKGDAVYEISLAAPNNIGTWFGASANFPWDSNPFFARGGFCSYPYSGTFCFVCGDGGAGNNGSLRVVLVI